MQNRNLTYVSLVINYAVFGILLNSVGVVILQSINTFFVSEENASLLEGFKDLPIAIVSFLVASSLPRLGYKNAMIIAYTLVGLACLLMPVLESFWMTKILFLIIGSSFALVKISVYSVIGLLTNSTKQHSSLMNFLEGSFMLGVLSGYWIFSYFIDSQNPESLSWLNVYWLLSVICLICIGITIFIKLPSVSLTISNTDLKSEFVKMLKLIVVPSVYTFAFSAFFYVLIEQSIQTWLPTFNNKILSLPATLSVQVTSLLAIFLAIGRLCAAYISRRIDWYIIIFSCLFFAASIILFALPLAKFGNSLSIFNIPLAALLLPLSGLFLAPIYPILNSVILSSLDRSMHASMTGVIVISSALGGTIGSMITGFVFANISGQYAFYLTLLPMLLICIILRSLKAHLSAQDTIAEPSTA